MSVCISIVCMYVLVFKALTFLLTQTFLQYKHPRPLARELCAALLYTIYHILLYIVHDLGACPRGKNNNEVQTHKTVIKILNYTRMHLDT